jgi:hypothetical protein
LRGPSPIIVGVTGHRDLRPEDEPELGRAVDDFFHELAALYPHSDLLVISGLAEGADRLVASRAQELGHPVIALLPMPVADYECDFVTHESLLSFRATLDRCARTIELPWVRGEGVSPDDPHARRAQYVLLGDELVAHSAIMLALWNGHTTGLAGGTDTVVTNARRGRAEAALSAFDAPATFVAHIVTPRASQPDTIGVPFSRTSLAEADKHPCLVPLRQQDTWNRDSAALWEAGRGEDGSDSGRAVVERTFNIADTLAISEQVVEQRAFLSVYLLFGVATLIFGAYGSLLTDADWLLVIDVVITAAGFIAYAIASTRKAPDRFQDYRALAEGLRVQAAWAEAGLHADVADHYTNHHRGVLDWEDDDSPDEPGGKLQWIRRTVRVSKQLHDFGIDGQDDVPHARERIRAVDNDWIAPQAAYFDRAAGKKMKMARRCRVAWRSLAVGALAVTIGLTIVVEIPPFRAFGDGPAKGWILFVITMLSIGAALVQSYADKRAPGALAKRYVVMHRTFAAATRAIREQLEGDFDEAHTKHIVFELGKEALAENADWMIAMRDRPLESVLSA